MLFLMAWRNVWRNPTRSLVVMIAVALGIGALIFLLAFTQGIIAAYIKQAIERETSHIQIHQPDFKEEFEVRHFIDSANSLVAQVASKDYVKLVSARTVSNAMVSSPKGARGVMAYGIAPEQEAMLTNLEKQVYEGEYLSSSKRNPILLSGSIAEKLNVKLRSKVILTMQTKDEEIQPVSFRVTGLFKTQSKLIDDFRVFVRQKDLNQALNLPPDAAHEVALLIDNLEVLEEVKTELSNEHKDLLVETYKQISPDLELFNSQINATILIMTIIVMLALVFGIINTMMMAVLERTKELGMLMSIGMNKWRVFRMIVLETIFLTAAGAPLGLLGGYIIVEYFQQRGIDLSRFSDALKEFGMAELVYLELDTSVYIFIAIAVVLTAIIGAIYPAFKAMQLKPVEALRKI